MTIVGLQQKRAPTLKLDNFCEIEIQFKFQPVVAHSTAMGDICKISLVALYHPPEGSLSAVSLPRR